MSMLSVAALAAAIAQPVGAHAYLDRALPVVGSVVREPPKELTLWFTQRIEPSFSEVRVLDPSGEPIDTGKARVDPGDGKTVRVSLPKLTPGAYRVKWRVLSVDTHVSEGEFTFDVAR